MRGFWSYDAASGHSIGSYDEDSATSAGAPFIGRDRRAKKRIESKAKRSKNNEDNVFKNRIVLVSQPMPSC